MLQTPYTIRDANETDTAKLSFLITQLGYPVSEQEFTDRYVNISRNRNYHTLVIAHKELVVGMAGLLNSVWYERNGNYVRILAFVIDKKFRRQGLGKILMAAVEAKAAELNANAILVNSTKSEERVAAYSFYQGMGYEIKSTGFVRYL